MYHYYFDGPQESARQAEPAAPTPQGLTSPVSARDTNRKPSGRKARKPHGERVAALILAAVVLVLGGMVVLLSLRPVPLDLKAWVPVPHAGGTQQATAPLVSSPAELEHYPNGDGTQLLLAPRPEGEPLRFQEIYQKVIPSVVSITAATPTGLAQGTGVIMSEDGYIITNAHVIEGSFRVEVSLEDGRTFGAKLLGSDTATDLAVLKIQAEGLTPAVFGDSEDMMVGDTVVAIGNPMGEELRGTMTDGILSAINRDMEVDGNTMTLLQTTAALNTGNSGGALVNDQGQVIGITNMKLVSTNAYTNTLEGLGFAIPTATVKPVVDALIASGHVAGRPTLGVTVRSLYKEEKTGRDVDHGLLVVSSSKGSDAYGKLKEDDILLTANGVELNVSADLLEVKETLQIGDSILFEVDRRGERLEISVKLIEQYELQESS